MTVIMATDSPRCLWCGWRCKCVAAEVTTESCIVPKHRSHRAHTKGVVQLRTLLRRVLRRVLETAFEKVLRRVLRRRLAVGFKGKRVPRRVLRRGSKKGFREGA